MTEASAGLCSLYQRPAVPRICIHTHTHERHLLEYNFLGGVNQEGQRESERGEGGWRCVGGCVGESQKRGRERAKREIQLGRDLQHGASLSSEVVRVRESVQVREHGQL